MPADDLERVIAEAVRYCRRRSAAWWRQPSRQPGQTRADVVAGLVSLLATYERGVPAVVPRPEHDTTLADQLAVVGRDLLASRPPAEVAAAAATACLAGVADLS